MCVNGCWLDEVLEVILKCGIAIAFLEIALGLGQNSAQHAIKNIRRSQFQNGVVGKKGSIGSLTTAIP